MDMYTPPKPLVEASVNDQRFLVNFIMGTYLGPDVKTDNPRRSALQRIAEGLPPYYLTDLGTSFIKLSDVESLYYYVLRNAHASAAIKLQSLYKYFKGHLTQPHSGIPEEERQFTSLFPSNLHSQGRYKGSFKIFKGIIIIDNPDISYIPPSDLERFKWLTGSESLKIDKNEAQLYRHGYRNDREESQQMLNYMKSYVEMSTKDVPNGNAAASAQCRNSWKRKRLSDPLQSQAPVQISLPKYDHTEPPIEQKLPVKALDLDRPATLVLGPAPTLDQWNPKSSIVFTGTVKDGRAGPPVGLVDIGINKDAYLFRVALPGVKKDQRQFSCEIESNGKVLIRGVTVTGEKTILRHTRVFQMKTQHLCPPGPFTVSFRLPGPVDPRLFTSSFGSDGILEAIVRKYRTPTPSAVQEILYVARKLRKIGADQLTTGRSLQLEVWGHLLDGQAEAPCPSKVPPPVMVKRSIQPNMIQCSPNFLISVEAFKIPCN